MYRYKKKCHTTICVLKTKFTDIRVHPLSLGKLKIQEGHMLIERECAELMPSNLQPLLPTATQLKVLKLNSSPKLI